MFDLIVPVHNSIHHVRPCLNSIFAHSTLPYQLYIVNDNSQPHTCEGLAAILADKDSSRYTLINNEQNLGYLKSCNKALALGHNPYVILLNSDTIVRPGYLEKILEDFESDSRIGIINPVSTWANWTRIPFPSGYNIHNMAREVEAISEKKLRKIDNASGFFFACRRKLFDELGLFDEVYGFGYWEETDFCMRVLDAGYQVIVDDSLYIFHYGWGSFQSQGRNENMRKNKEIFMRRWEKKYKKIEAGWKACNPIAYMQNRLEQKDLWKHRNSLRAPAPRMPVEQARIMLDRVINDKAEARRIVRETQQNLAPIRVKDGEKPKILYILPGFTIYGGIISVLQIVNNLVLAGYDANVAVYGRVDEKVYGLFPLYFRPYFFASKEEMIAEFPDCDLIVATGWETVYISILIHKLRPFLRMAYFVQDYEPDFYVPDHPKLAAAAEQTYYFIRHQIVKTLWLKNMLLDFPGEVHMIPLGLHLDFFFDYGKPRRKQILSLARPSSGRRNFAMVKQVFEEIHRRRPEIELALYGEGYKEQEFSFPVKSYGKLDQMQNVAGALNDSTLLLDSSIFQGFGRPGLEAMACGTGAVLTQEGGITQYAKHDYNCLLIDPTNKEQIVERLLTLIDDESKRRYLVENGLATAKEYSQLVEGERTIRLLESVLHDDRPHLELS